MAFDVQFKAYSNVEEWRTFIPIPRTPRELGKAVEEIVSTRDWFRIVITHAIEKPPEKPRHD